MSHTYHLVCVSCGDVIDVGKLVHLGKSGEPVPLQFGGWRDQSTAKWMSGPQLWSLLERWHILHRGHEVRLLSEPFLDAVDPEGQLRYCDSARDVLDREVEPLPDDEADAREVPEDVTQRLQACLARKPQS